MRLAGHQISAFLELAQTQNFSRAAQKLGVTQSALSQRIANLESELETTLIIRDSAGLILTSAGELLLRYCQSAQSLEDEVLNQLKSNTEFLAGTIRIAGFSSVIRSVVMKALAPMLRANPNIICEFKSYEMIELYDVLKSAKADMVILDYHLNKNGIIEHVLGQEEYVAIESSKYQGPEDIYLDHGPHDNATESFFHFQNEHKKSYRRSFMGDVYGIIDGVENGLGRAIMSSHLIRDNKKIKIIKGHKKYLRDVTLHYFERPYYSKLHQKISQELIKQSKNYL